MLIARIEQDKITVADYRELFPQTSFPAGGPTPDFMEENGCLPVTAFKPFDRAIEKLVACEPYVEDGQVFTVKVEDKTDAELDADTETEKAKHNAEIKRKIAALEAGQGRAVREAALGDTTHLIAINDKIEALRAQIK